MRKLRRKFSVWLLVFVMLAGTFSGLPGLQIQTVNAAGDFNGGSGTEGDPYQIATAEQFDAIRNYTDDDTYFILTADINLNNYSQWQPIGSAESESGFHLDGDGHTITNVSIDDPSGTNLGLFSKIDSSQTIKNLNITVSRIVGSENVGALAGINAGTITNVHVAGADNTSEIEGKLKSIGGLVGYNQSSGIIQKSSTSVQITSYKIGNSTTDFVESVGGLVGYNEGEVLESYSTSEFKLRSASAVGGLVGTNDGIIFGSYASGSIIHDTATLTGYDVAKAGGLVGIHGITSNEALISFSYATGSLDIRKFDTTSHEWNTPLISHHGGLVGRMDGGEVYYSYARGNVKVHTNNQHLIGGLIGEVRANYDGTTKLQRVSKVHNTYATGNIVASGATSGSYLYYGALVGSFYRSNATTGYRNSNDGSIHSSYFLNATPDPIALGTGRTLEQLKDSAQFTGWDFDARWEIKPGVNDGHPVHRTGAVDVRVRPIAKESFINQTHPYTARVFVLSPDGPVSTALDWNVSGGTGVSIDQNGLVTVGEDAENVTYTIKAALQDKPSVFSEGSISIIRPRVTGLSITPYTAEVAVGESLQLSTTVSVVGGASTDVTYESNSPTVLSVDETGLITVSKDARPSTGYRVTVRSVFDPTFYHDKPITVRAPYVQSVGIKNKYSYSRVMQGGTITFEADVVKHGDITDEVTWKTNSTEATIDPDTGVLTVSEDATPGSQFTVTATSKADVYKSDSVTLRVQAVTGLTFYSTDHYVLPGGNINISPTVQVVEYAPTAVNWEYNEDIIESVESEYGVYKFKIKEDAPYGTYPLTARSTVKPTVFGTTNLQVHGNATSVEIVPTEITLVKNQKYQFNATVLGESSNIPQQVNWRPSNYSAISIGHYDGLATINASAVPGTSYTIIATSNLGSKTAEATITVAEISSVTLDQTEVTLLPGGTIDLEATVTASSEEVDKSIVWTSNNDDAVSVDNGVVTVAHDAPVGTYTITATSVDTSKAATTKIHVVRITDVQVTPHTAIIGNGTTEQFSALVLGEGNNIQNVIWSSNDTNNYVTVSESGLVTVDEDAPSGDYIITATSTMDSSKFGTATITVSSVTGVTLDETDVILLPGETKQLVETVTVVGDVAKTVEWKSSDTNNYVTVSASGLITVDANAPTGTYYITATSMVDASKLATATVNVVSITSVKVTPAEATVHQGGEQTLSAVVNFDGVGNSSLQEVIWESDDNNAVTVDEDGIVTVAAGADPAKTYTIRATSKRNPSVSGTATITVTAVIGVTVTPETKVDARINLGQPKQRNFLVQYIIIKLGGMFT